MSTDNISQPDSKLLKKVLRMVENTMLTERCNKSDIISKFGDTITQILDMTCKITTDPLVQSVICIQIEFNVILRLN